MLLKSEGLNFYHNFWNILIFIRLSALTMLDNLECWTAYTQINRSSREHSLKRIEGYVFIFWRLILTFFFIAINQITCHHDRICFYDQLMYTFDCVTFWYIQKREEGDRVIFFFKNQISSLLEHFLFVCLCLFNLFPKIHQTISITNDLYNEKILKYGSE